MSAEVVQVQLAEGWSVHPHEEGPTEYRCGADGAEGILQVSRIADEHFDFISGSEDLAALAEEMGTQLGESGQDWGKAGGGKSGECAMGRFGFSLFLGGQYPSMLLFLTVSANAAFMWTWLGPDPQSERLRDVLEMIMSAEG